ncbi:MAG: rRNA pseudouridine synthase [Spirochaetales bacterium]|nr:rRNA pseudouridine synthase [Spirochaetales bacterium]
MSTDEEKIMRLQKYLSSAGVCSRRESEKYIEEGRVSINGKVAVLGDKVSSLDEVVFDGKRLTLCSKKYIILNKPENVICSRKDERGRKTVFDLLNDKDKSDTSLFHIGRLDYNSCGLIMLTNDGDFANNIIHPSKSVIKGYMVTSSASFEVAKNIASSFTRGITVDGVFYRAKMCKIQHDRKQMLIELKEGKKREIREVYKHFACEIVKLERIFIGKLRLADLNILPGEYVSMTYDEIYDAIYNNGVEKCR